jgi:hypothetical protein
MLQPTCCVAGRMLVRVHLLTLPGQASRLPWAGISISNGMLMPTSFSTCPGREEPGSDGRPARAMLKTRKANESAGRVSVGGPYEKPTRCPSHGPWLGHQCPVAPLPGTQTMGDKKNRILIPRAARGGIVGSRFKVGA